MHRVPAAWTSLILLFLLALPARAESPSRTPLQREIETLRIESQAQLRQLTQALSAAKGSEIAPEIEKQIRDLKRHQERTLLGIQLEHARIEGRAELASRLQLALAHLDSCQVEIHPVSRAELEASLRSH